MTVVKECPSCKETIAAKQQDAMYGKGIRVHNQTATKSGSPQYRCTVCGQVRN